MLVTDLWIAL